MRTVATHLLMATAGMALWAWAVINAQAHSVPLAVLAAGALAPFAIRRLLRKYPTKEKGKTVKKLKTWALLTVVGALALFLGERRVAEAVVLDPDNMPIAP